VPLARALGHRGASPTLFLPIEVTPDTREESNSILTADDIEQIASYYELSNAEPIEIAPGVVGMTFTDSKHPSFGTATENVWFAYRGSLYEVTASNGSSVEIGSGSGGTNYFFPGKIDDVRVYNRALSATEVKQLYNAGW
jgi:Concanavalin A-like lectin/glucanases superfamily